MTGRVGHHVLVRLCARLNDDWVARWSHVPRQDLVRARVLVVAWWLPGINATTFGFLVVVRSGHEQNERLLAHELVHVRQWRRDGAWQFLRAYLGEYIAGRRRGLDHWESYAAISAEVEARALADRRVPSQTLAETELPG